MDWHGDTPCQVQHTTNRWGRCMRGQGLLFAGRAGGLYGQAAAAIKLAHGGKTPMATASFCSQEARLNCLQAAKPCSASSSTAEL